MQMNWWDDALTPTMLPCLFECEICEVYTHCIRSETLKTYNQIQRPVFFGETFTKTKTHESHNERMSHFNLIETNLKSVDWFSFNIRLWFFVFTTSEETRENNFAWIDACGFLFSFSFFLLSSFLVRIINDGESRWWTELKFRLSLSNSFNGRI